MAYDPTRGKKAASETALDADNELRLAVTAANNAVWEAMRAAKDCFEEPLGIMLFGIDRGTFDAWTENAKSDLEKVFNAGVPIFTIRFNEPESVRQLSSTDLAADSLFEELLKTFPEEIPLKSLAFGVSTTLNSKSGRLPVSTASLRSDDLLRKKIKEANIATWEAVRAAKTHALGPERFATLAATLKAWTFASKAEMLQIFQTGVPIFSVTPNTAESVHLLRAKGWSAEKLFGEVLRNFSSGIPVRTS